MKEILIGDHRLPMPEASDHPQCAVAGDGGTIAVWFVDTTGTTRHVFLDRRIRTATRDHVYVKSHPGSQGTEHIGFSAEAVEIIEEIIKKAR